MTWVIEIANWRPTSINTLLASHWRVASRKKLSDRQVIAAHAHIAKVAKATGKRKISIEITKAGQGRLPDPDNMLKVILDALKSSGYLVDDSSQWVEWRQPVIQRGKQTKTVIMIQDVEAAV